MSSSNKLWLLWHPYVHISYSHDSTQYVSQCSWPNFHFWLFLFTFNFIFSNTVSFTVGLYMYICDWLGFHCQSIQPLEACYWLPYAWKQCALYYQYWGEQKLNGGKNLVSFLPSHFVYISGALHFGRTPHFAHFFLFALLHANSPYLSLAYPADFPVCIGIGFRFSGGDHSTPPFGKSGVCAPFCPFFSLRATILSWASYLTSVLLFCFSITTGTLVPDHSLQVFSANLDFLASSYGISYGWNILKCLI